MRSESSASSAARESCQWLDQHGDYLFGYALKRVRNSDAAEDLVQETLLAAISARSSFGSRSSIRSWLVGILKHKISDHFRSKTSRPSAEEELDVWIESQFSARGKWRTHPGKWGHDPGADCERQELGRALSECLEKLPPRTADVFLLNEQQSHSAESLSQHFALSAANIAVILYRARMALRRCLELSWFAKRPKSDDRQ